MPSKIYFLKYAFSNAQMAGKLIIHHSIRFHGACPVWMGSGSSGCPRLWCQVPPYWPVCFYGLSAFPDGKNRNILEVVEKIFPVWLTGFMKCAKVFLN